MHLPTFYPSVNSIIFLAPISAFDQVLTEDPRVNRMEDSLLLCKSVVSNKLLGHVNLVLFLNKCDLLQVSLICEMYGRRFGLRTEVDVESALTTSSSRSLTRAYSLGNI